ncbi:alanine:cation symporter family protein [Halalkalibacter alkalisediminis]|uniref:Alanine:cation symporter family protein n=2 Tax=Halalkalibacter alkalisediminis TaxID=935616 RepID=A0ABV6NJG8_9BACI
MAITNLMALLLIGKISIAVLNDYEEQKKAGKDPVFYASRIKGLENVDGWNDESEETKEKRKDA